MLFFLCLQKPHVLARVHVAYLDRSLRGICLARGGGPHRRAGEKLTSMHRKQGSQPIGRLCLGKKKEGTRHDAAMVKSNHFLTHRRHHIIDFNSTFFRL